MCPLVSEDDHRRMFEGNINETHGAWLASKPHVPECHHDADYFEIYTPLFLKSVTPFPGIAAVIEQLVSEHRLIIISSTITSPINGFLKRFNMQEYFTEVMGNDVHASKVEKMRMVFEKYGITAADCVFITDTLGDMREAAEHGMGTIGCSWGFHTHETLEKGIPFRIVDTPGQLPDAVADYFASS